MINSKKTKDKCWGEYKLDKDESNIQLEPNIPKSMYEEIIKQAKGNKHYNTIYRVAKWGQIEEKVFLNTYGEIQENIIPDNEERYPKDEIGTYSISVYTERTSCDKFIKMLKKSKRLKQIYPYPIIIKGKTSNGFVQKTKERKDSYDDPTHIDWWLFAQKKNIVLKDFEKVNDN